MTIKSIHLKKFRSYADSSFEFSDGVNVIAGPNGTGKTNLLEAVYVAMRGGSFRVADKELAMYGSSWFRIDAHFDEQQRTIRYQADKAPAKQISINDGASKRFMRPMNLPVVLFEPDMLRVLSGSPARRRRLLDEFIIQWYSDGGSLLRRYERVLLQRNNILRDAYALNHAQLEDRLFAWDVSFAELADSIEQRRRKIIAIINVSLSEVYGAIAKKPHTAELYYDGMQQHDKQNIIKSLHYHRRADVARGHSTIGPHRSDFTALLNGKPTGITASRGEQRSLVLAMKYIEAVELKRIYGTSPILLLDDVMSELDSQRRQSLIKDFDSMQTIVTTTSADSWKGRTTNVILRGQRKD